MELFWLSSLSLYKNKNVLPVYVLPSLTVGTGVPAAPKAVPKPEAPGGRPSARQGEHSPLPGGLLGLVKGLADLPGFRHASGKGKGNWPSWTGVLHLGFSRDRGSAVPKRPGTGVCHHFQAPESIRSGGYSGREAPAGSWVHWASRSRQSLTCSIFVGTEDMNHPLQWVQAHGQEGRGERGLDGLPSSSPRG